MIKKFLLIILMFSVGVILLVFSSSVEKANKRLPIKDNDEVYLNDSPSSVKELYITIMPADDQSNQYANTFAELNEYIYDDLEVKVLFQEGADGGSKAGYYGFGLTDANATMKLRGQSSRIKEQKSYKIDLNKKAGLWNGYEIININKHPFDSVRIRNKLSFDLLKEVSGITSLKTQFVHVFIKDYSMGDYSQKFVDYGLFTQIENVDEDFLKSRNLDKDGWLYKIENFEFYRYPETLLLKDDINYNKGEFEKILDIKGNDDHSKLISMINDVNNGFIHINDVIDKHFDRENYITWLAINLIIDNVDTNSKNYYLYSSNTSDKWYFLPWDYDKGWSKHRFDTDVVGQWQQGISNYWGVVLHQRFLKNNDNVKDLSNKIEELSQILNEEKINDLLSIYKPIIELYLGNEPDSLYNNVEEMLLELERLPSVIKDSKERYYQSLETPMPVFMGNPLEMGENVSFNWTKSYDLQSDSISYTLEISDSPVFETIVYYQDNILETNHTVKNLDAGKYYWKVTIIDSQGNNQSAFDYFIDENNLYYFGIKEFYVTN